MRAAACDHASFSSEGTDISRGLLPMIQALDPPRHDALRARVLKAFTASRIALLEPEIRRIARELLGAFAGAGRADLVAEFARQLPSRVIGALIGIPPDRREKFLAWTDELVEASPESALDERFRHPAIGIYRFAQLLGGRRAARRDDLMSALLDAEIDGEGLSQEELLGFCFVLIRVLNPVLRGWGEYFRTGNASSKFQQIDRFVATRLVRLLGNRGSWRRRPFHLRDWPHRRFVEEHRLHQLLGTIRYPGATHAT